MKIPGLFSFPKELLVRWLDGERDIQVEMVSVFVRSWKRIPFIQRHISFDLPFLVKTSYLPSRNIQENWSFITLSGVNLEYLSIIS